MTEEKAGLSRAAQKKTEIMLKRSMAKRMVAIQKDRHLNATSANIGNAQEYVEEARILREILEGAPREHFKPVLQIITGDTWIPENIVEAAGINGADTLEAVLLKLEAIQNPNLPKRSLTEYDSVPGR